MKHPPSEEQSAIYEWGRMGKGNLIVQARAGCGKTTTIVEMVHHVPEKKVLMAAFNKSIATELQSRVSGNVEAKTLHGLGYLFVRQHANVRMDEEGRRGIDLSNRGIEETLKRRSLPPSAPPREIVNLVRNLHTKARDIEPWLANDETTDGMIDVAARFDLMPEERWSTLGWTLDVVCESALAAMRFAKEPTALIDFADMIFLPLIHGWIRPWFEMVIVDEAQDLTPAQLTLACAACKRDGRICIVGDSRQSIYSFRGADADSLERLKQQLDATELGLRTTYRCARSIVELAARIVPDFRPAPNAPDGEVLTMTHERMMSSVKEGDFILSRKNAPLVRVCLALLRNGVRASIKGRDIGKGIAMLIRRLEPSTIDALPALARRWADREIARASKMLSEERSAERAGVVIDQVAIIDALVEGASGLGDLDARCERLFADNGDANRVMLSSVHKAKGLEADRVFLLRQTFMARSRAADDGAPAPEFSDAIEEENIRYVAITRAKTSLVWVEGENA